MKRVIGRYEIISKIGEGGMASVYRARDLRLQRPVALKVLEGGGQGDAVERFVQEARTASILKHPNIVTIHDVDQDDGVHFIAMEYVEGRPLSELIPEGGLPVAQVLMYAHQIASALAAAHACGIIHRDLKPSNVMVTPEGAVKVVDFGLAKRYIAGWDSDASTVAALNTAPGTILGTVAYMSPEQAAGESTDARSDIFSFGTLFYEMLTGSRPFQGGNVQSTLHKIHFVDPEPIAMRRPGLPAPVIPIVQMALAKKPEDRFQNGEDLRAAVQKVLDDLTRPSQPLMRSNLQLTTAIVFMIAAVIAVSSLVWKTVEPGRDASIERLDPSTTPASALSAFDWTTQGTAALRRFDKPANIDTAIASYKRALERDARFAPAYAGLAIAYLVKESSIPDPQWIRLAEESARLALEINADLAIAHVAAGRVFQRSRRTDDAEREYQTALELEPRNADAQVGLAELAAAGNERDQAERYYKQALELNPADWNIYQLYGRYLYRNSRYDEAIRIWEQGTKITPDNILLLRNLGAAFHMADRFDDAAAALQRALEIEPAATVYNNLGTVRFFQGRYAQSAAAFEKAVEMNPSFYLYWGNLGDARRWMPGSEAAAKEAYRRAIELADERLKTAAGDVELTSTLAVYLAKSGNNARSLTVLQELDGIAKRTPGSYFKAAVAYEVIGNRGKALEALESAVRAGYSTKEIKNEPEFTGLRNDPRYHALMLGRQ